MACNCVDLHTYRAEGDTLEGSPQKGLEFTSLFTWALTFTALWARGAGADAAELKTPACTSQRTSRGISKTVAILCDIIDGPKQAKMGTLATRCALALGRTKAEAWR